MPMSFPALLAAADPLVGRPLFGHAGLALLAVSGAIAAFIGGVAWLGRVLAAGHPAPPPPAPPPPVAHHLVAPVEVPRSEPILGPGVASEVIPVVLAATAQILGARARVVSIRIAAPVAVAMPSLEALMQQWSHEGRRQIYSSHKVR